MTSPEISVIIPTYAHEDFVVATIESVFDQASCRIEVIVVNDGSPDGTAIRLAPLISAGKVRYIEQVNGGQACARNRGFTEATGEFVLFLDDDDILPLDTLQRQRDLLQNNPTIGAVAGEFSVFTDVPTRLSPSEESWHVQKELTFDDLLAGNPFRSPGQVLIRASTFRSIGGFAEDIWGVDDFDLWLRLAQQARIACCTAVALHYRLHSRNASRNIHRMYFNAEKVFERHLCSVAPHRRSEARRQAYRWLHGAIGTIAVQRLASGASHTQSCRGDLQVALSLVLPALKDMTLFRALMRDLAPAGVTRVIRRLRAEVRSLQSKGGRRTGDLLG